MCEQRQLSSASGDRAGLGTRGEVALAGGLVQIAARLRLDFPDDPRMRVSHETIYTSLFVEAKASLPRYLTVHLRTWRVRRRPQRRISVGPKRIAEIRPLRERPPR